MTLNEHVNATNMGSHIKFTPDDGYALWLDNEEGKLDENGEPIHYYLSMSCSRASAESTAPHIWARLIEEGMQVYGVTNPTEKA